MTKVRCLKCGKDGYLMAKQTVSSGINYQYWYVKHKVDGKIKWCYIGKTLPVEYEKLKPTKTSTQTGTQISTQNNNTPENLNLGSIAENDTAKQCRGSLAWFGRQTHNLENKRGKRPVSRGRGLESRPRHHYEINGLVFTMH